MNNFIKNIAKWILSDEFNSLNNQISNLTNQVNINFIKLLKHFFEIKISETNFQE